MLLQKASELTGIEEAAVVYLRNTDPGHVGVGGASGRTEINRQLIAGCNLNCAPPLGHIYLTSGEPSWPPGPNRCLHRLYPDG